MPGKLTSKMFDALVQRIERMADGISRHKSEDGFPKALDDAKYRSMRQDLENFREKYEAACKASEQAYEVYAVAFKKTQEAMAQSDDMVRGFYGKTNLSVSDFGTAVISKKRVRKPAPQAASAPKP